MDWKSMLNPMIDSLEETTEWHDFHAKTTIQFGELIESGFDWGANDYYKDKSFTETNRNRLNQKIVNRYYFREICAVPPGIFKHFLMRKLNEIMPKYNELYKLINSKDFHVLREETNNSKYRHVFSEYPQTQLKGDSDYATNAQDNASGSTRDGAPIDMMIDYQERYNDVDVMILNELEVCFLSMMTSNINGGV